MKTLKFNQKIQNNVFGPEIGREEFSPFLKKSGRDFGIAKIPPQIRTRRPRNGCKFSHRCCINSQNIIVNGRFLCNPVVSS